MLLHLLCSLLFVAGFLFFLLWLLGWTGLGLLIPVAGLGGIGLARGVDGSFFFFFLCFALACCSCLSCWLGIHAVFRCQSLALRVTFANSSKSNQKCRAPTTQPCGLLRNFQKYLIEGSRRIARPCALRSRAIHGALTSR